LQFTHHAEVAALDPRRADELLEWAAETIAETGKPRASRELRAAVARHRIDAVRALPSIIPEGRFGTIVIDPPWDMEKIDRYVRPNQIGFDYPTMSEAELANFPVPDMAADDCHLFCWTTQKFLPIAERLVEAWGFRYVLSMVWHKPGGFQPIGLPQYNCEFIVYGRKGTPEFVDTKAFPCCFSADRREHSRKPDHFYDLIRRVTAEGRIDVFSRERREGFAQYGNEIDKFAP
jgi:N6-adenosine-specific RNA methylase IME4